MDLTYIVYILPILLKRVPLSIFVVVVVGVLSIIFASLISYIRLKKIVVLHQLLGAFVSFMRCTPGTLHLFIVYYGLPVLLGQFNIDINHLSKTLFCIISMTLYFSAYISEILRPGYLAVPKGQLEAAESIGMTAFQANYRIIVPQMVPIVLPSLGNALMDIIKYTSLLFLIGVVDIMGQAEILDSNSYGIHELEIYFTVGIIYWIVSIILNQFIRLMEKRTVLYNYY